MPFDQYVDTYLLNLIEKHHLTLEYANDHWFIYRSADHPYVSVARNVYLREALNTAHIILEGNIPRVKYRKSRAKPHAQADAGNLPLTTGDLSPPTGT